MSTAVHDHGVPWPALQRGALIAGAIGAAVWVLGWVLALAWSDEQTYLALFFAYLYAFAFVLAIPLGSMAIWMIHNQTGGAWGYAIHRVIEAATRTVPFMAVLFVPLIFGLTRLYLWADLAEIQDEHLRELLTRKSAYLNVPGFLIRAAVYFMAWSAVAIALSRRATALERHPDPVRARGLQLISGPGFLVYGLGMTFASIDWLMSLEPDWYSTIYGMLVASGQFIPALGFAVAITACLTVYRPLAETHDEPAVWNDLGNLMLASVMFWAYLSVSQWLLIWSGNLLEEIPWYLRRSQGGWQAIAWLLGLGYFGLPFLALLSRRVKRDRRGLIVMGFGLMAMSAIHHFWLIKPVYAARAAGAYAEYGPLSVSWLDVAALAGVGGITFAIFLWQLRSRPLTPPANPFLVEQEVASRA